MAGVLASNAEKELERRIGGLGDADLLALLLQEDDLTERERAVFEEMKRKLSAPGQKKLSPSQRSWAVDVLKRLTPIDSRLVPVGKPVATPEVLMHLPKKPPGRK